ncbi:MAG TPA: hypothetical protein VHZ51_14035 [Ktedonobacteraceae bacterium]|nr:hypothetical protein [Ktedonobacteraceae bacterium]
MPATMMRSWGGPNPALRASRSPQLQRSCERTARGGRGGGKTLLGDLYERDHLDILPAIACYCLRQ